MLECETWYEFAGRRHNEQRFRLPREDVTALRHAVAAIRRRNPAFHIRLRRIGGGRHGRAPVPLADVA